MRAGFLGFGGTFAADCNLALQLLMAVALGVGAMLARRRRYRAHGLCQATVVILNLALIFGVMLPGLRAPSTADPRRLLGFAHGILGAAAESLGLYVLLV